MTELNWTVSNCIRAHDADVRAVAFIKNTNFIVTGSRDKTCHVYDLSSNNLIAVLQGHQNYIQTIASDPSENLLYTGCNDNKLRTYDLSPLLNADEADLPLTINQASAEQHHSDSLVSIDLDEKVLVTGSWDKTAKLYKKSDLSQVAKSLEGHSAAVWSVKILTNRKQILTGSADKSIKQWNLKGECISTFFGHTDCVRALTYFHDPTDATFWSTGNDGTFREWFLEDSSGASPIPAHQNYCYSMCGRDSDKTTFSCGEDASLLVYRPADKAVQNIDLPCVSAWDCDVKDDCVCVGTNAGDLFVFKDNTNSPASADAAAIADFGEIMDKFKAEKAEKAKPAATSGMSEEELAKIPGKEILEQPGKTDGYVQMVRPNPNTAQVDVYQYTNSEWILIGQATGTAGPKKEKFEGKLYDKVFNVEVEEGQVSLRMPVNFDEDPWEQARVFMERHSLPLHDLEPTAKFIIQNTPDEYKQLTKTSPSVDSFDKPVEQMDTEESSSSKPKPSNLPKILPEKNPQNFSQEPPRAKVVDKLRSVFGDSLSSADYDEIHTFAKLNEILGEKSFSAKIQSSQFFPLIDLLRVTFLSSDVSVSACEALLKRLIECYQNSAQNTLCTMRCVANYMSRLGAGEKVAGEILQFIQSEQSKASQAAPRNANLLMAVYTCFLNYIIADSAQSSSDTSTDELAYDMLATTVNFISSLTPTDIFNTKLAPVIIRALAGLGTWASNNKGNSQTELVQALIVSNEGFQSVASKFIGGENVHFKQLTSEIMELMEM